MNPMNFMKLKGLLDDFNARHPKLFKFLRAVSQKGMQEGSVIEIKITNPDGNSHTANIKVSQKDLEFFQALQKK